MYISNVLTAFSVHILPHVDLNSSSTTFTDLVCILVTFMAYFVYIYLSSLTLSLHVNVPLVTHSVYIPRKCWSKSYVPPLHYLVNTLVIWIDYFVHFLLVGEPNFICVIFLGNAPTLTYSVHIPPHIEIFDGICGHNSISTTSSWPSLFTSDFYDLLCLYTSPSLAHIYIFYGYVHVPLGTYSVHKELFDGLLCTHTS